MTREEIFIPATDFLRIQVIDDSQGIKLVKAWGYVAILNIGQATEMNNKVGPSALAGQFVASPLDVSVGQAQTLARSAQPGARLHAGSGKLRGVAQTSNCHGGSCLSVSFPERPIRICRPPRRQIEFRCAGNTSGGALQTRRKPF